MLGKPLSDLSVQLMAYFQNFRKAPFQFYLNVCFKSKLPRFYYNFYQKSTHSNYSILMSANLMHSSPFRSQENISSSNSIPNPQSPLIKYSVQSFTNTHTYPNNPSNLRKIDIDIYGDYLDVKDEDFASEKRIITDRFIPTRKQLKNEMIVKQKEESITNQNIPPSPIDPCSFSLPDIFKKCIMNEPKKSIKIDNPIQFYQNNNIFKYNNHGNQTEDFQQNVKGFDFTDELVSSIKNKRRINKLPFKVLDAPALQDDFYLNLIDWSQQNFLAVGLASNVYLWNGDNSKVTKLCDLGLSDTVTSVGWSVKGPTFSLGTNNGEVHIWDITKLKRVRVMNGHSNRVSSISWSSSVLSTGSRDKTILNRDIRSSSPYISKYQGHKQQVCGLKWSPDEQQLCSGGNDNKLMIWNSKSLNPVLKFSDHIAAVKAVAWSPHQHGLLASGGGTADRNIRFRNTLTGQTLRSIDTGSQVCNLIFGKTINEIVSTHGYSFNQINIWKYPKMEKVSTLMGHTMRVLYLTMSPDGSTIVTGAGDETLRFWNVFPSSKNTPSHSSLLAKDTILIR